MNKIDNSDIILELHNFKKGLSLDQDDIERQITFHMGLLNADDLGKQQSQKRVVENLNFKLQPFTYDNSVKSLLEGLNSFIKNDELFYELEDLYRLLENDNQGMLYRNVMKIVLDIINETNVRNQEIKILNELSIHDWIPAVKNFMFKRTTDPRERQNITSKGGKSDVVYSIVEKINTENKNGYLTYIGDKWFFISESNIDFATPSDYITDRQELYSINLLQKALEIGTIADKKINFTIDEDLSLSISVENGDIFINNEKADKSATLESVFDSALIPFMRKDLYPIVLETIKKLDNFVELDIVQKITNITVPYLENYVFNYKNSMFSYTKDTRYGSNLYQYDSATVLCNEVNSKLGYDLSDFLKNKFTKEVADRKDLESKEKFISNKLSEVSECISSLEISGLLESSDELKSALVALISEKSNFEKQLFNVKSLLANNK